MPDSLPENLEFLRDRVRLYSVFAASTSLAALLVRAVLATLTQSDNWSAESPGSRAAHGGAVIAFSLTAALAPRVPQTRPWLMSVEMGGFFLGTTAYLVMVSTIPFPAAPTTSARWSCSSA